MMSVDMSMVMLGPEPQLSVEKIANELKRRWPQLARATQLDQDEQTLGFQLGTRSVVMGIMPAPIPDIQPLCDASWLWRDATRDLKSQSSHLIITVLPGTEEAERIDMVRLLTQVTAAVLASCPQAIGVLWVHAHMVVQKSVFVEMATKLIDQPYYLWVNFQIGKGERGMSGYTTGMSSLGFMEIEVENCPESHKDLHDRLVGLVNYLLEKGPVIRNGDTLGETQEERIQVVYAKSAFGQEGHVMRLEYGAATNSARNLSRSSKKREMSAGLDADPEEVTSSPLSAGAKLYLAGVALALALMGLIWILMFWDPAGGQAKGRPLMLSLLGAEFVLLATTWIWMLSQKRLTPIAMVVQALVFVMTCLGIPMAVFGVILLVRGSGPNVVRRRPDRQR